MSIAPSEESMSPMSEGSSTIARPRRSLPVVWLASLGFALVALSVGGEGCGGATQGPDDAGDADMDAVGRDRSSEAGAAPEGTSRVPPRAPPQTVLCDASVVDEETGVWREVLCPHWPTTCVGGWLVEYFAESPFCLRYTSRAPFTCQYTALVSDCESTGGYCSPEEGCQGSGRVLVK